MTGWHSRHDNGRHFLSKPRSGISSNNSSASLKTGSISLPSLKSSSQDSEKEELKKMLSDAMHNTPKDPRHLTVITYEKNGNEAHETILSMDRKKSSFEHAKENLAKLNKNQKIGQNIGWETKNGQIIVEKYWGLPKGYLEQHPEKKEDFYKYGFLDKRQLITKFFIQDKQGKTIKVTEAYGRIEKDPDWGE